MLEQFNVIWEKPLLHLIHSNRLEVLAYALSQLTASKPLPPLQTEQIVVQNAGMGRWLSLQLAQYSGIAANLRYIFPAEMTWELLRKVLPDVPERDPCSPKLLRWRLLEEFLQHAEEYPELAHYLRPSDEGAAWQLAQQVASVLDGYVFFRPDWIRTWEQQPDLEDWQQRIWQRVVKAQNLPHWVGLQDAFFSALANARPEGLPERILFFSVPAVSEAYIQVIQHVAQYTEVYFFIINPSMHYWSDIKSERQRLKFDLNQQDYIEVGNPLLASWGAQGRDFIGNLRSLEPYPEEQQYFVDPPEAESLLDWVQLDMLQLQNPQVTEVVEHDVWADDSIRIHSCHSALREVQVLQDQLLALIEQNPALNAAEMVVMTPDIDHYAPYIEAVFGTAKKAQYLPFSIADQSQRQTQSLTTLCLQLLELPDSRFEAERLFALLENQLLCAAIGLQEAEVEQCRVWVQGTNIRWGVDSQRRRQQGGLVTEEHTWRAGLDRLLLGYAMPSAELFAGVLPYNHLEGSDALVLGKFLYFLEQVFALADWSQHRVTMSDWASRWQKLLQALFNDNSALQFIYQALDKLTEQAERDSKVVRPLSWRVFRTALRAQLEQRQQAEGFMGRGITFCALMPMRSVPFQVVALLGMQDGAFPRIDQRLSFDRLGKSGRRRGDRSRRDEDRYLFLESVLSARRYLYISYVGQGIYDNSPLMPSVLVSELLEYVARRLGLELATVEEALVTKHPLQAFSPRYFAEPDGRLFTYRAEYADAFQAESAGNMVFWHWNNVGVLPDLPQAARRLSIETLVRYFQQPAREFLTRRFHVQMRDYALELPEREPFELAAFDDRRLADAVFQQLCRVDGMAQDVEAYWRAEGRLPHGVPGVIALQKQQQLAEQFYAQVAPAAQWTYLPPQAFDWVLGDFALYGALGRIGTAGRELFFLHKLYAGDWIKVWLEHLCLNAFPLSVPFIRQTHVYTVDGHYPLAPLAEAEARGLLTQYLEIYWRGLHQPVPWLPKASYALLEKGAVNLNQAEQAWLGSDYKGGEIEQPENQLLYRGHNPLLEQQAEFVHLAEAFWLPLWEAIES